MDYIKPVTTDKKHQLTTKNKTDSIFKQLPFKATLQSTMSIFGLSIVLKASNGKYVGSADKNNRLEANNDIVEANCVFTVVFNSDGTCSLKGSNGKYVHYYSQDEAFYVNGEALIDSPDIDVKFRVTIVSAGVVRIQTVAESKYMVVDSSDVIKVTPTLAEAENFTVIHTVVADQRYNQAP